MHETTVNRRYAMGAMSARARFVAKCSCGWEGKVRQATNVSTLQMVHAFARAEADAAKHVKGAK